VCAIRFCVIFGVLTFSVGRRVLTGKKKQKNAKKQNSAHPSAPNRQKIGCQGLSALIDFYIVVAA
jgi:hypothetical protein